MQLQFTLIARLKGKANLNKNEVPYDLQDKFYCLPRLL